MGKNFFRTILISITVVSLCSSIIFGSDVSFNYLDTVRFSWPHLKNILFAISTSVFSSTILLWGVDYVNRLETEKNEKKRRLLIYKKLKPGLLNYYNFYLDLFVATRKETVKADSHELTSLSACEDEFCKQLLETNPFYKDSYCGTADKLINAIKNFEAKKTSEIAAEKLMWYNLWAINANRMSGIISNVEEYYNLLIPVDLFESLVKLDMGVKRHTEVENFIEQPFIKKVNPKYVSHYSTEEIIKEFKFFDTLKLLETCMEYIEKDTDEQLRHKELSEFNNRESGAKIGANSDEMSDEVDNS